MAAAPSKAAQRSQQLRSGVKWVTGVVSVVAALAGILSTFVAQSSNSSNSRSGGGGSTDWVTWVAVAVAVIVAGALLIRAIDWFRRRLRRRVDREIRTTAEAGDASVQDVARRLGAEDDELVQQLAQRYLVDDSPVRREVEAAMFEFLPLLPRSAKRMLNHLRLHLALAVQQGLLEPDSPVTPTHLAKWIVLNERWPDLALAVTSNPGLLEALEAADDEQELTALLLKDGLNAPASADLYAFLRDSTRLSDVVDRLVRLDAMAA